MCVLAHLASEDIAGGSHCNLDLKVLPTHLFKILKKSGIRLLFHLVVTELGFLTHELKLGHYEVHLIFSQQ